MAHAIIITFRFGGLAQLVRAPASHAGGLGFESLILHHTVRTRTRFFMKKGSGTFCLSEVCVCDSNKHPSGAFEQQNRLPGNPKSHDVEFFVSIKDSSGIHVKNP